MGREERQFAVLPPPNSQCLAPAHGSQQHLPVNLKQHCGVHVGKEWGASLQLTPDSALLRASASPWNKCRAKAKGICIFFRRLV